MPGEHNAKRRALSVARSQVDRSTVRARDLLSDVESQPQARTLVRVRLQLDSAGQRIKDEAPLALRNCRAAIKDANGDGSRLVAVKGDVDRSATIPVLDRAAYEIRDKLLDAGCIPLASAISVTLDRNEPVRMGRAHLFCNVVTDRA